jgi:hypothetical protein
VRRTMRAQYSDSLYIHCSCLLRFQSSLERVGVTYVNPLWSLVCVIEGHTGKKRDCLEGFISCLIRMDNFTTG